jgi:hypothetical protein
MDNRMIRLLSITYPATVVAVFVLFFGRLWLSRKQPEKTKVRMVIYQDAGNIVLEPKMLKKFSLLTGYIVISLVGISAAGATAVLDGALSAVSSDDSVMTVTPQEGGLFRVDFVGVGQASLMVSGDADLSEGVRTLSQMYQFEIYDQTAEADHFDLTIVEVHPRNYAIATESAAELGSADAAVDSSTSVADAAADNSTATS